jgi:AcrR family transcriptional regulator
MTEATRSRRSRSTASSPEAARETLTPNVWIDSALEMLVDGGIEHVRVDVIAKTLSVTRGSFYWHFRDRDDLLAHMLEAWRNAATEQIIERFDRKHEEQRELVHELLSLPFRGPAAHRAARVELAIRDWARRDPMARHAVDDVDSRRISYIAQCFTALGFDIAEAHGRAFLLYSFEVAETLLFNQGTASQKKQRSALAEQLLLTRLDGAA